MQTEINIQNLDGYLQITMRRKKLGLWHLAKLPFIVLLVIAVNLSWPNNSALLELSTFQRAAFIALMWVITVALGYPNFFSGNLIQVTNESLVLKTGIRGEIVIRRMAKNDIRSVEPSNDGSSVIVSSSRTKPIKIADHLSSDQSIEIVTAIKERLAKA